VIGKYREQPQLLGQDEGQIDLARQQPVKSSD